jgi:hypothetical protein
VAGESSLPTLLLCRSLSTKEHFVFLQVTNASVLHGMRLAFNPAKCSRLRIVFVIKCVCASFNEHVFMLREVICSCFN